MDKISMNARKEILDKNRTSYAKASKKQKTLILNTVCQSTGLSRDRAARLLAHFPQKRVKPKPSGRKPVYTARVVSALEHLWALLDFASGKRLAAGLPAFLEALLRFSEWPFDEPTTTLLRRMSAATMDRLLQKARTGLRLKGISTTKPGTLLKKNIPVRLGNEWDENQPGFVEIDLVAHCGTTTSGEYINTLDVTDIYSGWTDTMAVLNKAQRRVYEALLTIRARLPFPLRGIDSDNGSEFINMFLYQFCQREKISFTRSRPYQKNDNCHVEQKNWHVVRRNIGYDRYEGEEALTILNQYYSCLRLYSNFFLPQTKLIEKSRTGASIKKTYEIPATPYQRLLAFGGLEEAQKQRLNDAYRQLNPAALKREMSRLLDQLLPLAVKV